MQWIYFVARLSYLAAWPFLEVRPLWVFIPFFVARLTHPPTQETVNETFYSEGLRWPNTVFARAFADVIQRVHKDCKNKHVVNRGIILFIQTPHYLRYFSLLLNAVYWWLYSVIKKDMLRKVTTQRTQKFLAFLCYRKNPVKCSACAVAQKIETECFCRNLPISNDPVVRISRNLAKK